MPSFMKHLQDIWRCSNLYKEEKLNHLEISPYQISYLINISKYPGISQEQLSKNIYVHKSNVARQLSSLEEKGFIYRENSHIDKRVLLVYPTDKTLKILPEIKKINQEWNELLLKDLDEKEKKLIIEFSETLSNKEKKIIENIHQKD